MKPKPVIGAMRFSTLSQKDVGSYFSSREKEWDEHVFSILQIDRLRFRLRFLLDIILPQMAKQSVPPHPDWFSFIVVTSTLLPDEIKGPLHAATNRYPWLRVIERKPTDWIAIPAHVHAALKSFPMTGPDVPYLSFRLDDDDTLATSYLERVQPHITAANVGKIFTFPNGRKVLWDRDGFRIVNEEPVRSPCIAIGLAAICSFNFDAGDFASELKTVFVGGNHFEFKNRFGVIEDDSEDMFIWSHHCDQDTYGRFKSVAFKGAWQEPPADISSRFANFPALANFVMPGGAIQ